MSLKQDTLSILPTASRPKPLSNETPDLVPDKTGKNREIEFEE
jgi:hypothetical protein